MFLTRLAPVTRLADTAERLARRAPWTNAYGVARSLIALSTFLTLALNPVEHLFRPVVGVDAVPITSGMAQVGLFALLDGSLELARLIALAVLALVIAGWRPRVTGILHWYVCFSFMNNATILDGGDHLAGVLTLLLVPITLTDPRRWHWGAPPDALASLGRAAGSLVATTTYTVVRLQVAVVYFHAAVGKMPVQEWADGTAVYYWATHPAFGAAAWLEPLVVPLLAHAPVVILATWGTMVLELFLAMALVMPERRYRLMLTLGVALHAGIIVLHGLVSFSLVMFGALVLYLRPRHQPFAWPQPGRRRRKERVRPAPGGDGVAEGPAPTGPVPVLAG